jgi:hypothetical protein
MFGDYDDYPGGRVSILRGAVLPATNGTVLD